MEKIVPCLWFNDNAEEAVRFYIALFPDSNLVSALRYDEASANASGRPAGSILTIDFTLNSQRFTALNGGPAFSFTPAVSFVVQLPGQELDALFAQLSAGGEILMPLDRYDFSERYAFLKDRFGVAWQLMVAKERKPIVPCLLFVGDDLGNAEAAVERYIAVFKDARVNHLYHYEADDSMVLHASFMLEGQEFMAMDGQGEHAFGFTEAISFVVKCETQEEIDRYWERLAEGGDLRAQQCGWLKDRFGISWQVVPAGLDDMLRGENGERVMAALLTMKKLDIAALTAAGHKD